MCGRYTLSSPGEVVAELFELAAVPRLEPRYNIAPTQPAAVVGTPRGERQLAMLRWGLVPYWARDPKIGNRMINARSESVADKPAFRDPFLRRRCLVPADGFFEWRLLRGGRQPYLVRPRDGGPVAFAGLWDRWVPHDGEVIESFTILTTVASDRLQPLHDRMPVILPREQHARWLDPSERSARRLETLLAAAAETPLDIYPVAKLVNSPRNDEPQCIAPLAGWQADADLRI